MNRQLDVFIVVHSAELIEACDRDGRFSDLQEFRYLFVGNGDVSTVRDRPDVIVARSLADNIEGSATLLSFTGWYAVARNQLAAAPNVAILEYDVQLTPEFYDRTVEHLNRHTGIVGFVPFKLSHPKYLHATHWLAESLERAHGIDVGATVESHLERGGLDEWTATSNAAMSTDTLSKFVEWFLPATEVFVHDPIGAHVHERALPVFCITHDLENLVLRGVLRHEQQRSHSVRIRTDEEIERAMGRSPSDENREHP